MVTIKEQNIILIGFMGSGKSSVGKRLARRLNYHFEDTDQMIEMKAGCTINHIFERKGEAYFRELETAILEEIKSFTTQTVIATGGGMPVAKHNRERLKEIGHVVYLKASKETIVKRLSGDKTRPKLRGDNLSGKVDQLLTIREPIYEEAAHQVVETDSKPFDEIIDLIVNSMK